MWPAKPLGCTGRKDVFGGKLFWETRDSQNGLRRTSGLWGWREELCSAAHMEMQLCDKVCQAGTQRDSEPTQEGIQEGHKELAGK